MFVGRQHRETVFQTQFIGQIAEPLQRSGRLAQHITVLMEHGIDDKMRVGVLDIQMGSNDHFTFRPGFLCELHGQRVSFLRRDVFRGMEGLIVVEKPHRTFFVEGLAGGNKFMEGHLRCTV